MTAPETREESQIVEVENQILLDEPEESAFAVESGMKEESIEQASWLWHDYSDEPRLRDLPMRLINLPRILLLALVRFYQLTFSRGLPANTCRFYPSCSHYGYQAIYKHGAIKGSLMAAWRILRCNPFNRGGFDPVP